MTDLEHFRQQLNHYFLAYADSPLSDEQKLDFEGLRYYDPNPALVIEADLDYFPAGEPLVEMETTTGDLRHYRRWARIDFTVDGAPAALTIYSDPWGESLFLPFKDGTNGAETYGAGRYLDNHRPGLDVRGDRIVVDFNFAYNPYCAYNAAYSCPLPPRENWLEVPIAAGEKVFG